MNSPSNSRFQSNTSKERQVDAVAGGPDDQVDGLHAAVALKCTCWPSKRLMSSGVQVAVADVVEDLRVEDRVAFADIMVRRRQV